MRKVQSNPKSYLLMSVSLLGLGTMIAAPAHADDTAFSSWAEGIKYSGHVEAGITFNPNEAAGSRNVGALFEDRANQVVLNQLMGTVQRPIDSSASDFDWGFTLTGMYGSDSRFTHGFAEFDHLIHDRNQLDIVEGDVAVHMPVLSALLDHGIDLKVGQIPSPMGAEVIDATGNYLYSHSYIFNFGVPYKGTGFLTTAHVTPVLDLYTGLDTGVNAFVGGNGYNNNLVKGQFGFGLNLLGGDLTVLGFTHIGAENPKQLGLPKDALRYLNDITTTYKATPDLTLTTDINYIQDEGLRAIGYGLAQYGVYALNDHVSLVARGEVWRDNGGAFVASFPGDFDFVNAERGLPASVVTLPPTTYGALTLGANLKPEVPKMFDGIMFRPEFRVDDALNGSKPFNKGRDRWSVTPAVDVIYPF